MNAIENAFEGTLKISEVTENDIQGKEYDIVLVLNSLHDREMYGHYIDRIKYILKSDGYIVDPYINKKQKRSFIHAWFGYPMKIKQYKTVDEYKKAIYS